jgi:ATP-dependent RNA helicase TDRD9
LRGPYSPLEIGLHKTTINDETGANVSIDQLSVNSILLNDNVESNDSALIIAADVLKSRSGKSLYHTTKLPNLPGLPLLLAMAFSSGFYIDTSSKPVKIVFGLKFHPQTNESYYPEHDFALPIKVSIDQEDVTDVKRLKYFIQLLTLKKHERVKSLADTLDLLQSVKKIVRKLTGKRRNDFVESVENVEVLREMLSKI